jgi:hypothetical protein
VAAPDICLFRKGKGREREGKQKGNGRETKGKRKGKGREREGKGKGEGGGPAVDHFQH